MKKQHKNNQKLLPYSKVLHKLVDLHKVIGCICALVGLDLIKKNFKEKIIVFLINWVKVIASYRLVKRKEHFFQGIYTEAVSNSPPVQHC